MVKKKKKRHTKSSSPRLQLPQYWTMFGELHCDMTSNSMARSSNVSSPSSWMILTATT